MAELETGCGQPFPDLVFYLPGSTAAEHRLHCSRSENRIRLAGGSAAGRPASDHRHGGRAGPDRIRGFRRRGHGFGDRAHVLREGHNSPRRISPSDGQENPRSPRPTLCRFRGSVAASIRPRCEAPVRSSGAGPSSQVALLRFCLGQLCDRSSRHASPGPARPPAAGIAFRLLCDAPDVSQRAAPVRRNSHYAARGGKRAERLITSSPTHGGSSR